MAAWLTVYCTRPVSHITADDILAGIGNADFLTIAEGFGIEDEDVVDRALAQLRIELVNEVAVRFRLRYRPLKFRPVLIWLWTEAAEVKEQQDEALEKLEEVKGKGTQRSRVPGSTCRGGCAGTGLESARGHGYSTRRSGSRVSGGRRGWSDSGSERRLVGRQERRPHSARWAVWERPELTATADSVAEDGGCDDYRRAFDHLQYESRC
jgi:hypothetical protein